MADFDSDLACLQDLKDLRAADCIPHADMTRLTCLGGSIEHKIADLAPCHVDLICQVHQLKGSQLRNT